MYTLRTVSHFMLEVKKSRHLARAAPVSSADQAMNFITEHSDHSANHNCWAFRCGAIYRSFDDGEPSGTAGRPILAAIDAQQMDQVVVLVSRWFGGIKLGAGGLARAYGGAAAQCLRSEDTIELVLEAHITVETGFDHSASVHALIDQYAAHKTSEIFTPHGVQIQIKIAQVSLQSFTDRITELTRGQARVRQYQAKA